jgi:hypothetical protein
MSALAFDVEYGDLGDNGVSSVKNLVPKVFTSPLFSSKISKSLSLKVSSLPSGISFFKLP